jgi:hypothetical protein
LHLSHHPPTFPAVSLVRRGRHDLPSVLPVCSLRYTLAEPQPPKCEKALSIVATCHILTAFQYLGPSALQLSHLFVLVVVNGLVLFGLILLLGRSVWGLALNMTTIESWEVERHHALLRRARVLGGQLDGPDGTKVRIEHQEFPWDVGIWSNFRQAMGTWNMLAWGWPFASSPSVESGLVYEHNEIDGR